MTFGIRKSKYCGPHEYQNGCNNNLTFVFEYNSKKISEICCIKRLGWLLHVNSLSDYHGVTAIVAPESG